MEKEKTKMEETRGIGSRQVRCTPGEFHTREEEDGKRFIEGYFAVFGSDYDIGPGMTESIDEHAFDGALADDIRCLTDHDTRLVLGRTTAGTLSLSVDSHGLYGRALVNPNDQDALNTLARVDRGDVTQASFGFDILDEETAYREDGSVHWTIKAVKLYEVSVCTFPAYKETNLSARSAQREAMEERKAEAWRENMRRKLNGIKSPDEEEGAQ